MCVLVWAYSRYGDLCVCDSKFRVVIFNVLTRHVSKIIFRPQRFNDPVTACFVHSRKRTKINPQEEAQAQGAHAAKGSAGAGGGGGQEKDQAKGQETSGQAGQADEAGLGQDWKDEVQKLVIVSQDGQCATVLGPRLVEMGTLGLLPSSIISDNILCHVTYRSVHVYLFDIPLPFACLAGFLLVKVLFIPLLLERCTDVT